MKYPLSWGFLLSLLGHIYGCVDGTGKWTVTHNFKNGALTVPSGYSGTVAEVEAKSNAAANVVINNNGVKGQDIDDELHYEDLDIIKALVVVKDATITLCNEAKVPEKFWDDTNTGYTPSPFHGPTLSGVGDGAISELKDIPELVGFGLEIATEPEKAKATWNGIKSMTPAKVKKMLLGAGADKLAKYTAGGNTMKHEAGKDGVQVAMFVVGAVKSIGTNAAKIAELEGDVVNKLDEITDETLDATSNAVEETTGKEIDKALKEGNTDGIPVEPPVIENSGIDVAATSATKGRKLTWSELKALWKRGNDFNTKVRNLVPNPYQYYEVTVEKVVKTLPDGTQIKKRFRLDSYNPGADIVSRKATTFDEISTVTFQKYLDELTNKYASGLTIIKPGTPINGQTLSGVYKLEVPLINQNSSKLAEFTKLATDKGVTIIFKAE